MSDLADAMRGLVDLPADLLERAKPKLVPPSSVAATPPSSVAATPPSSAASTQPPDAASTQPSSDASTQPSSDAALQSGKAGKGDAPTNRTGTRRAPYARDDGRKTIKTTFALHDETEELLRTEVAPYLPPGRHSRNDLVNDIVYNGLLAWLAEHRPGSRPT